jgi:hypothetical protein
MQRHGARIFRQDFAAGSDDAPRLQLVVLYSTATLTRAMLEAAAALTRDLGGEVRLLAIHAVPYPCPLNRPDVDHAHLTDRLTALVRDSGIPVRVEIVYARDREAALQSALKPGSVVLMTRKRHAWRTREERIAHRLAAKGRSVAVLYV